MLIKVYERPPIILQYSRRKKGVVACEQEKGNGERSGNHLGGDHG